MKLFFSLLIIHPFICIGQSTLNATIIDGQSGQPIPYASIRLAQTQNGTHADESGKFSIGGLLEKDSLIFSAVGYKMLSMALTDFQYQIELEREIIALQEIQIKPIASIEKVINKNNPKKSNSYFVAKSGKVYVLAHYQPYLANYANTPYIKSIKFTAKSASTDAIMNVMIYEQSNPDALKPLVSENILVKIKKGKRSHEIDLTPFQLKFPENGILIAFEWIDIASNHVSLKSNHSGYKTGEINIEPSLMFLTNMNKQGPCLYQLKNNQWRKSSIPNSGLALEITLSN